MIAMPLRSLCIFRGAWMLAIDPGNTNDARRVVIRGPSGSLTFHTRDADRDLLELFQAVSAALARRALDE